MPAFALLAGAAGCYLRLVELWNVFDEYTGLPQRGAGVTYLLIALSAAFLLIVFVFTLRSGLGYISPSGFENAFGSEALAYPFTLFVIGLVWLGATVRHFINMNAGGDIPVSELIFSVLSAFAAISSSLLAIEIYQDPQRKTKRSLSIVPTIFMCYWLILLYRTNASNPILLSYCYQCLAIIASALGFYFVSGFAYDKQAPCKTIFVFMAAIYFCFVTLADDQTASVRLIYIALIAINVVYSSRLIKHLQKKAH